LQDGAFAIPVLDPDMTYRLHFLDAEKNLGGVAELKGKQAGKEEVTVRLTPCGEAWARFADDKGKPLADYRPVLTMLLPPGPHTVPKDLRGVVAGTVISRHWLWAGHLDPGRYRKGPQTDAEGRVTLSGLIPGATYRLLLGKGNTRDFTAQAGTTIELPRLTTQPAPAAKLPEAKDSK
jgi:hypothetical protein